MQNLSGKTTGTLAGAGVAAGARLVLEEQRNRWLALSLIALVFGLPGLAVWLVVFIIPQLTPDFWWSTWGLGNLSILVGGTGFALALRAWDAPRRLTRVLAVIALSTNLIGLATGILWAVVSAVTWLV